MFMELSVSGGGVWEGFVKQKCRNMLAVVLHSLRPRNAECL